MKLTELFTSEKQITTDLGKTQVNSVRNDTVNRQIKAMAPGQTIQGEVVAKNGSEVQIRLADDLVLQARLDQNMNLEVGKNMTFEVRNNGKSLVLSPLFTNVATDANVLKALDMASLPVNGTTVSLTKQLMEAGLSIDRNTLQQVYREVNMFPEAQTTDIVNLHKMQMPVNESNVTQMASYRNLTHQLVTGLNNVLDAVPEMFSGMMESGDVEGAVKLYQQLVSLAQEGTVDGKAYLANAMNVGNENITVLTDGVILQSPSTEAGLSVNLQVGDAAQNTNTENINLQNTNIQGNVLAGNDSPVNNLPVNNIPTNNLVENILIGTAEQATYLSGEVIMDIPHGGQNGEAVLLAGANAGENAASLNELLQTIPGGDMQNEAVITDISNAQNPTNSVNQAVQQFHGLLGQLSGEFGNQNILTQISQLWQANEGGKELLNPLINLLKQQWTITPEEVADADAVEGLYNRLNKQLKSLSQAMESAGQADTAAHRAVTNLTQNLDFMQQVNQLYTYVQLPLRLQQGEAHGDLYVYTNKKHLASKDGQISALLHLDMEHLGPVDVYVSMMNEKVNTKFYLQDDEMLDFLMEHIDILTDRLQKRGYQCSYEMQVHEQGEESQTGIQKLLAQENHVPLAEYAFDVRT